MITPPVTPETVNTQRTDRHYMKAVDGRCVRSTTPRMLPSLRRLQLTPCDAPHAEERPVMPTENTYVQILGEGAPGAYGVLPHIKGYIVQVTSHNTSFNTWNARVVHLHSGYTDRTTTEEQRNFSIKVVTAALGSEVLWQPYPERPLPLAVKYKLGLNKVETKEPYTIANNWIDAVALGIYSPKVLNSLGTIRFVLAEAAAPNLSKLQIVLDTEKLSDKRKKDRGLGGNEQYVPFITPQVVQQPAIAPAEWNRCMHNPYASKKMSERATPVEFFWHANDPSEWWDCVASVDGVDGVASVKALKNPTREELRDFFIKHRRQICNELVGRVDQNDSRFFASEAVIVMHGVTPRYARNMYYREDASEPMAAVWYYDGNNPVNVPVKQLRHYQKPVECMGVLRHKESSAENLRNGTVGTFSFGEGAEDDKLTEDGTYAVVIDGDAFLARAWQLDQQRTFMPAEGLMNQLDENNIRAHPWQLRNYEDKPGGYVIQYSADTCASKLCQAAGNATWHAFVKTIIACHVGQDGGVYEKELVLDADPKQAGAMGTPERAAFVEQYFAPPGPLDVD